MFNLTNGTNRNKPSRPRSKFSSLGLALSLTVALSTLLAPVFAASNTDLERIETKFFQHSYPKDEMPVRLERLEKMVFGESKTGSDSDRLSALVTAIPAPAPEDTPAPSTNTADTSSGGNSSTPKTAKKSKSSKSSEKYTDDDSAGSADKPVASDEKYPAVSAIEQKVLGKDHSGEDINTRLSRLETKLFGKPSSLTDLSDRTDALKQKTGIDIARQAPRGSDWADDDDDDMTMPRSNPVARGGSRKQPQDYDDYGSSDRSASAGSGSYGSGSYGMGGMGGAPSGMYGAGRPPSSLGYPVTAPSRQPTFGGAADSGPGVAPQVAALEMEVFGKNYNKDTLGARLTRLEGTVFPADKSPSDKSLPERVSRLAAVIPISVASTKPSRRGNSDMDDLDSSINGMQNQINQQQRANGGLGKVISSLSNMFNGGYSGGYQMPGGTMTTDPQTGMLYDPSSGNLIDPNTGAVVGRRSSGSYGGSYNTGGMGSMPGFSNGFSPYGSPYGGSGYSRGGMNFGIGGGGGGRGFGGMWP